MKKILLILFLFSFKAFSAENTQSPEQGRQAYNILNLAKSQKEEAAIKDFKFALSLFGGYGNDEVGSKHTAFFATPIINISYKEMFYFGLRGAILKLFAENDFTVSATLSFNTGRRANEKESNTFFDDLISSSRVPDPEFLQGKEDVKPFLGAGLLFAKSIKTEKMGAFTFNIGPRYYFLNGIDSVGVLFSIDHAKRLGQRFLWTNSIETEFVGKRYNQKYFGINDIESAASGLSIYESKSDFFSFGASTGLTYFISKNLSVTSLAKGYILGKNNAKSDLIKKRGSSIGGSAMIGTTYNF